MIDRRIKKGKRYKDKRYTKNSRKANFIISHIKNNIKEYTIVSILFVIGIVISVIFINNISGTQSSEISTYLNSFIGSLKQSQDINELNLLKDSIIKNSIRAILLWFMGSTVIGISIVYLIVIFRGFVLGYTISSVIVFLGLGKGLLFIVSSLLLQTILLVPCILALAVSGMKLQNSIMKDRRKENIKLEILRHTAFSLLILGLLIVCSLIEVYVSKNLFILCIKYF